MSKKLYCISPDPLFFSIYFLTIGATDVLVALFVGFVIIRIIVNSLRKKALLDFLTKAGIVVFSVWGLYGYFSLIVNISRTDYYLAYFAFAFAAFLSVYLVSHWNKNNKMKWLYIIPILALATGIVSYFGAKDSGENTNNDRNKAQIVDTTPSLGSGCGKQKIF
ncbi:MAG: hypothetical protein WC227_03220 [Patescibacteria group bacterium]|jgi:hypothetical protein